jgi:hypothetical protein
MKTLLLAGALIVGTASFASAEAISMFWDDCGAGGGVQNKTFACTSNVGQGDLYISVDPPAGVVNTNGHNHIIDLQSVTDPLPAWWDFKNTLTCRNNSLLASGDFTVGTSGGLGCPDPWAGTGNAGVAAYTKGYLGDPRKARIIGSIAYSGSAVAMPPGTEYYSIRLRINYQKTVGTGACAGCGDAVCIVLNNVRIAQPAPDPTFAVEVSPQATNYVTWQGGVIGGSGCPAEVPVQNGSWGRVKSLYR